jgi:2-polyprenyl-6-methoxyphenol hydroxylase-like FAD-dependent oxidoreductase
VFQRTIEPEILIVGAGVAGSPLAIELHRRGYDVLLVERFPQPRKLFKGEYLQPAVVEFFNQLELQAVFNSRSSSAIKALRFRDLDSHGQVHAELKMTFPGTHVGRTITHFDLITGLNSIAAQVLGQNLWLGVDLQPINSAEQSFLEKPEFQCQHPSLGLVRIRPKWVVGCDGRMSSVRKWMGGRAAGKNGHVVLGTGSEFIFGAELERPAPVAEEYEVVRSYGKGTLSAFSLKDHGQRLYYSSPEPQKGQLAATQESARQLMRQCSAMLSLGEIPSNLMIPGFPANTEWFGPVFNGRFLLAGDALSVTTPYGGQGMTSAMENIKYLLTHFDWRSDSKSESALQKTLYAHNAISTHERINLLNFGLYYTFFARDTLIKKLTARLIDNWERDPALKARVVRLFAGLEVTKPDVFDILALKIPMRKALNLAPYRITKRLKWA